MTLAFAVLACVLRGVNRSGALAGGLACFLLSGIGPVAFGTLAALFVMTWVSTRLGYRRKLALGVAERREGRNAWQVLANLAVAGVTSVAFGATRNRVWLVATARRSRLKRLPTLWPAKSGNIAARMRGMITTWRRVPAGTDGGITIPGSIAGLAAGLGDRGGRNLWAE